MPIIIKDFEWKETETTITIKIPLRGVHSSKVDIFYSKLYIKASFEQYFFEVFLLHPIDPDKSTCTFTDHIVYELTKNEAQIWSQLEPELSRSEKNAVKKTYIEEEHKRYQDECKEKSEKISELKRVAVREQMSLDTKQRKEIDEVKSKEKIKALQGIENWSQKDKQIVTNKPKLTPVSCEKNKQEKQPPPPIRSSRTINVTFTPREFPTPCRESRLDEENEWLRKQAQARRSAGFISEDIRPEERNPQFLKAKGDEFLKSGNYLGALSAYSFGIKINDKFADLYIARAEAHLAVGK